MASQIEPDLTGKSNTKWITVKGRKVALNRVKSPALFGKRVSLNPKPVEKQGRSPLAEAGTACASHEGLVKKIKIRKKLFVEAGGLMPGEIARKVKKELKKRKIPAY